MRWRTIPFGDELRNAIEPVHFHELDGLAPEVVAAFVAGRDLRAQPLRLSPAWRRALRAVSFGGR